MSKERDVVQAINAYLGKQAVDKSIMPLPKDHPLSPDKRSGLKGPDLMDTLRQAGEAIGVLKRKVPRESNRIDKARRPRNPIVTIKPGDSGYDEKLQEAQEAAQRNPQRERGLGSNRPIIEPVDKAFDIKKSMDLEEPSRSWSYQG